MTYYTIKLFQAEWSNIDFWILISRLEYNRRYYERQNSIIDKYANVLDPKEQLIDQIIIKLKKRVEILTTISLAINIVINLLN